MADKRSFPRMRRRLLVEYVFDGTRRTAFTRDVSHTGIFVVSAFLPKMGSAVSLVLTLADGTKLKLEGRVVRGRIVPASLAYSDPTGFCVHLSGYSDEFSRYLASGKQ